MAVTTLKWTGGYGEFAGLSTDEKPADTATGSVFTEVDTGKVFLYDAENETWHEAYSLQ